MPTLCNSPLSSTPRKILGYETCEPPLKLQRKMLSDRIVAKNSSLANNLSLLRNEIEQNCWKKEK